MKYYMWLFEGRVWLMMDLMLILLTACGLPILFGSWFRFVFTRSGIQWSRVTHLLLLVCLFSLLLGGAGRIGLSFNAHSQAPPFSTKPFPQQQEVIHWLQENVDPRARVLFEDIYFTPPFGHRIAPLAVYETGLEFIGGPSTNNQVSVYKIEFHVGTLAWIPVQEYNRSTLSNFVRNYNIGWVLAFSDESIKTFNRYPDLFEKKEYVNGYQTYRIREPSGYFAKGEGQIKASVNRIELTGLKPEGGEVVLRYHFIEGLLTEPTASMSPMEVPNDPQPFIRLMNPPENMTIFFP